MEGDYQFSVTIYYLVPLLYNGLSKVLEYLIVKHLYNNCHENVKPCQEYW